MQNGSRTPSKNNKKNDPRKKSNVASKINGVHSDIGEGGVSSHAPRYQISSGPSKATPIKNPPNQAYAGGAFTNSPAPSALPIPPFFSKSVPKDIDLATDSPGLQAAEDFSKDRVDSLRQQRETTPLDWMFDLARKKDGPELARAPLLSPPAGTPSSRSPAARDGGIEFPFELDSGNESNKSLGTPFHQRLSAAATPRSTSLGGRPMTDEERKAKTDALKMRLLGGPIIPPPSGPGFNDNNPFNAKNPTPRQQYNPRHSSNPSTPYQNDQHGAPPTQYFPSMPQSPTRPAYNNNSSSNNNNTHRPQSSGLRNIYNPTQAPLSPPPTQPQDRHMAQPVQSPPRHANFAAIYGGAPRPSSSENKPVSTEDSLDSLKKMLKMSAIS